MGGISGTADQAIHNGSGKQRGVDGSRGKKTKPFGKNKVGQSKPPPRSGTTGRGYTEQDFATRTLDPALVRRESLYATHTSRVDAFALLITGVWSSIIATDRDFSRYFTYYEFVYICGCAFLAAGIIRGFDNHTRNKSNDAGYEYLRVTPSKVLHPFLSDFKLPVAICQFIISATGYVTSDSGEKSLSGLPRYRRDRALYQNEEKIGFDFRAIDAILEFITDPFRSRPDWDHQHEFTARLSPLGIGSMPVQDGDVAGRDGFGLHGASIPDDIRKAVGYSFDRDPYLHLLGYRPRVFLRWSVYCGKLESIGYKLADPFIKEPATRAALLITAPSHDGEVIGRTNDQLAPTDVQLGILFGITRLDEWSVSHDLANYVGEDDGEDAQIYAFKIFRGLQRIIDSDISENNQTIKDMAMVIMSRALQVNEDGAYQPIIAPQGEQTEFTYEGSGGGTLTAYMANLAPILDIPRRMPRELGFKSWYKLRRGGFNRASQETRSYDRAMEIVQYCQSFKCQIWK